jgi:hypothetical protein
MGNRFPRLALIQISASISSTGMVRGATTPPPGTLRMRTPFGAATKPNGASSPNLRRPIFADLSGFAV